MTEERDEKTSRKSEREDRSTRLAEALRKNLKRRKARARSEKAMEADLPEGVRERD